MFEKVDGFGKKKTDISEYGWKQVVQINSLSVVSSAVTNSGVSDWQKRLLPKSARISNLNIWYQL